MWIEQVAPQLLTELLHNYQGALGVLGPKGSENGSWKEAPQPKKSRLPGVAEVEFESEESREHFAQPGEGEGGALSRG